MRKAFSLTLFLLFVAACSDAPSTTDPGTGAWQLVPRDQVRAVCGLDPDLLDQADAELEAAYAIIRYGRLCHEYYPEGEDRIQEVFSTTKTLGAVVTGIASWQTRDLPRTDRKTGPVGVNDRVDHWLDDFTFNPDAHIGHVLGMVGFNEDLTFPNRRFIYDTIGDREINRLSDILNTAFQQDPDRLGANLDEFTDRFLFTPLGMHESTWTSATPGDPTQPGSADKIFAFSWASTVHDMARLGLMMLNKGIWNNERILAKDYLYALTHPSFEDANANYGYLTWLSAPTSPGLFGTCAPAALWNEYPHGALSGAPDCDYPSGLSCEQQFDIGAWSAMGLFGQYINGHPGLDMVLVGKYMGDGVLPNGLWAAVRPALVAEDPLYAGDEEAFCGAYGANAYAPDRQN
jgi:hypothetical protein